MKRIILIGYMGVGKTTIGRLLAKRLGLEFYDLDWYIEGRYRTTISEIFKEKGEDGFRDIERRMLHELAEFENVVISSGGGTPCFFDNIDFMNSMADTVYLKASVDVLYSHLQMSKSKRPLLEGKSKDELIEFINESLSKREPYYIQARNVFDVCKLVDKKKVEQAVSELIEQCGWDK